MFLTIAEEPADCANTFVGAQVNGSGNCVSQVPAGRNCEDDDQCLHGLFCNSQGQCVAKKGANATCEDGDECVSGRCASGSCTDPDPCAD